MFETQVQQIWANIARAEFNTCTDTHGLRRALERLLDNPDIDDRDHIFFSFKFQPAG